MIKVNLLKDLTSHAHAPRKSGFAFSGASASAGVGTGATASAASRLVIIWAAVAMLVAGGLYMRWKDLDDKIQKAQDAQARLLQAQERLKGLSQELARFEETKAQLQHKIDAIERLKESKKGPVSLLNAVIQAVPANGNLWLTLLDQKEGVVKVLGETRTPDVLPDFMNNLNGSGVFASVDIEVIERNEEISKFSIVCASANQPAAPAE